MWDGLYLAVPYNWQPPMISQSILKQWHGILHVDEHNSQEGVQSKQNHKTIKKIINILHYIILQSLGTFSFSKRQLRKVKNVVVFIKAFIHPTHMQPLP
jgi:VanZ family protein